MAAVRIGARGSALAQWQAANVAALWRAAEPGARIEIVTLTSRGDEMQDAPLERMEGTGFFTSTIEAALLDRRIDVAVHSLKDLPVAPSPGLVLAAIPARGPVEDVLCARGGAALADLPEGARVGTSSPRRVAQLLARSPRVTCAALRGNVPGRLDRVDRGTLHGVILARAGLARLGLEGRATQVFAATDWLPAPGQGALAVQVREADAELRARLAPLDHAPTRDATVAEREVLARLRGGCSTPVGAYACATGGRLRLDAGVFALDGSRAVRTRLEGDDPLALGRRAADDLLARGAAPILETVERAARTSWGRA